MSSPAGIVDRRPPAGPSRRRRCGPIAAWVLVVAVVGCTSTKYVRLREVPKNPLTQQLNLTGRSGPKPSERTMQMLRRYDAVELLQGDPQQLVTRFQDLVTEEPSIELVHTVAELAYVSGKRVEKENEKAALDFFETSVAYAYIYLFDERFGPVRNTYDPQFRGACDLYNSSLESALRIVKRRGQLIPGATHTIESAERRCDVTIVLRSNHWHPDDFANFEFVSDYEVAGLTNQYQTYGLGVPLIAVRKSHEAADPAEKYYPPGLSFPVTAFLRVVPRNPATATDDDVDCTPQQVFLEIYDPLQSTDIHVAGRQVPLESDASTALAYYLNNPELKLEQLATLGLLHPEKNEQQAGLYMLQPYEKGKIPVVMIHGLWSSPLTWMEMFNDLQGDPRLRSRYQFWFFLYPTGQPFWISAAKLRDELAEMRRRVDPEGLEPALDEMVLVGHSMGGLVARLQTSDSGDDFWRIVSDKPLSDLKAEPETVDRLQKVFYFHANPSVARVITIGTPHHGSSFANDTTRWLSHKLISLPQMMYREQIVRDNPDYFRNSKLLETKTSIDSLAPESPILPVLLETSSRAPVKYHNIIGLVPDTGFVGRFAKGTDGVVSYESAHVEGIESELIVPSDHVSVHRKPQSVLEVRRILLVHLNELQSRSTPPVRRAFDDDLVAPSEPPRPLPDLPLLPPAAADARPALSDGAIAP